MKVNPRDPAEFPDITEYDTGVFQQWSCQATVDHTRERPS
jgi:hypothetical protein